MSMNVKSYSWRKAGANIAQMRRVRTAACRAEDAPQIELAQRIYAARIGRLPPAIRQCALPARPARSVEKILDGDGPLGFVAFAASALRSIPLLSRKKLTARMTAPRMPLSEYRGQAISGPQVARL